MSNLEGERELRRRQYLADRERRQLELAERVLKDKELLYETINDRITKKEKRRLEIERNLVKTARKIVEDRDIDGSFIDTYIMPESYDEDLQKKLDAAIIHPRDISNRKSHNILTDQEIWERTQASAAIQTNKSSSNKVDTLDPNRVLKESTLILPDGSQIDFELLETTLEEGNMCSTTELKYRNFINERQYIDEIRFSLPVIKYREEILSSLEKCPILIIIGETGSGKTTQIPQYLYEAGYAEKGTIACTQPRRVAAMSVANRVAKEMNCRLGSKVGYTIRFEDCTNEDTKIKYMTDGILLREFLSNPDLSGYSCLLIDEAHERSLHTDVLFGLVKDVSRFRNFKDDNLSTKSDCEDSTKLFKLIISSATLEAEKFSKYFDNSPIIYIPGRRYPVDIYYTKAPEANFIDATVVTVLQIHLSQLKKFDETEGIIDNNSAINSFDNISMNFSRIRIIPTGGDILCFLPGQQEIEECMEMLNKKMLGKGKEVPELIVLPIYASLPSEQQAQIFVPTPQGARKVVLATNIAETALTIDNIGFVIDCGFCKQNAYNPKTGLDSLVTIPCSRAAANQRAGRAGRVRPGKCFRLYTKTSFYMEMEPSNTPEIQRCNLGNVVLMLKSLGIDDLLHFDFMDPPPPETLVKALELLYGLNALDDKGDLTTIGRKMAELPLDPMYSKVVLASQRYKVVDESIIIVSMLSLGNTVFIRPRDKSTQADNIRKSFFRSGGDHLTLLNVYRQWENSGESNLWCFENFIHGKSMKKAKDIRIQLSELMETLDIEITSNPNEVDGIRKSVAAGFFFQTARINKGGNYSTLRNRHIVDIHPSSSLFESRPQTVVYTELVHTTKEYMRNLTEIKAEWLFEVASHYYTPGEILPNKSK
ncbi:putative pre-mRNA-processing protein 8 [Cryptosporidium serpentis]